MWDEYLLSIFVDLTSLFLCTALLLRYARLRYSHPGFPYLFFHVHTVTVRLFALAGGAGPLFSGTGGLLSAVQPDELVRAAWYMDIALWVVSLVWAFTPAEEPPRPEDENALRIDPAILRVMVGVCLVMGSIGIRFATNLPGGVYAYQSVTNSALATSSYLAILPSWFGLGLLAHVYYFGARKISSVLLAGYLGLMAIQTTSRFRVISAVLMLVYIWVERRGRRWPSASIVAGLLALAVIFFPMKELGMQVIMGGSLSEMSDTVTKSVTDVTSGRAADQGFLDQAASVLTLADAKGEKLWFNGYVPLLTLPIPRAFWPDKPTLRDTMSVTFVSTPSRPMAASGMIPTYVGEAYVDFGFAGIIVTPFVMAFAFAWFARRASRARYDSLWRFAYALISVNLIQIYRDGLASIVLFTAVNMMPLVLLILVHHAARLFRTRRDRRQATVLMATTRTVPGWKPN
jgi:hypothetical protein